MEVILAAPRGFCAGVHMAVKSLELALQRFGAPVYVYHEIVHNRHVVDQFTHQGAIFVDDLQQVPAGATVLFSAHGVAPEVRQAAKERNLTAIDATCPLVTKVHLEAVRFAKAGYTILLIGHAGHDEVVGTMGEAPEAIVLVETAEDVDRLNFSADTKLAYLTQTTLSVDDANRIIDRLRQRFPWIEGPPKEDICYATQNRQEAVRLLSQRADVVLVVGSQNSSNSQRLRELAAERGKNAYLIDGPQDIDPAWFTPDSRVLVTAGASAPETLVAAVVQWLQERYQARVSAETVREEKVVFPLPRPLRDAAKDPAVASSPAAS
ncbi:MAG: 4-hydroxy-3-methylbut-2-enyl diphosphate reductase [Pirellulaceae bacterium]|nr:MAG: 4-hydroxy-3-methylbut-2-enyl diphosphate reductase [Pirellulaceae bacterium]